MRTWFPYVFSVVLVALAIGCYHFFFAPTSTKMAYFLSQKVFNEFEGTKVLQKNAAAIEGKQKALLDSLAMSITLLEAKGATARGDVGKAKRNYQALYQQFAEQDVRLSKDFKNQSWSQINQYVTEFGKERKYQIILGANGDGNLMFADSTLDISKEIIAYLNQRYVKQQ